MKLEFTSLEELREFTNTVFGVKAAATAPVTAATAPVPTTPVTTAPAAPTTAPVSTAMVAPTQAPQYSLDDLIAASAPLMDTNMDGLINLLSSFGVQTLQMLPPTQYAAFATGLRGLGGSI